ncbi:phosphate-starvation-inducible protein PsiE [Peribacillus cavernae]|uniref:Protein PsiE n=1 Tax=Peribacillus cavernae TaxID=1674310 RepID=A0A3S0UHU7_9BACI|nr:phosphate-starvation-inducible protein PsiE [Peribacillus cavernae]MDQ0220288.1 protein PsiE [Peribacillus cavernae]RUQ31948.1 phosphate-starvation-inducible protein PsiE [Peribacillus cavernae]
MIEQNKNKELNIRLSVILQFALNTALVLLAATLCVLLGKEIIYFIRFSIFEPGVEVHYKLLERILIFFLYFEFIAMIVKYFQENYHFPMRYFLYIGITAMIRLIIVYHDNPVHTLLYTCAVLVLVISFYIMNSATARKGKL